MKRLLLPLLAALALPTTVDANIDPKIVELCMKAADFTGCVNTMSGNNIPSKTEIIKNKRQELLDEIAKIPSRIANTSMRDYSGRTMDFTDALALSSPEEVGERLYEDAQKLQVTLDLLYATWQRDINTRSGALYREYGVEGDWDHKKNLLLKNTLDKAYGINTIDMRCNYKVFGVTGLDILEEMVAFTNLVARSISKNGFVDLGNEEGTALIKQEGKFCPDDPRKPKKVKREDTLTETKKPVTINCKSAVWKNKPRCKK